MASFSEDIGKIRSEFDRIHASFLHLKESYFLGEPSFDTCSMGMSNDYLIAVEAGSTMVRIGSMLFGLRNAQV